MKINFFEKLLGSGLYTGFIPVASGTFGSMAALLIYWIPGFENLFIIIPSIILFTVYGIFIGNKFDNVYGKDPAEYTLDEMIGQWIALLFLPKTILISIIAFISWRLFDIIKPFPARKLEELPGGLGIIADDIIASVYSLIFVHIILIIFNIN
ncbi:MAG TPA: phosphatidylglycerophosphatase A [Ignavibacteriaceae bacterium]|jgi:phosphatidylglycerophosphatase A